MPWPLKKIFHWVLIALIAVLLLWFTAQWLQEPGEAQLEVVKAASELDELKEKLIIANKILDSQDLIAPYGHVSARIPNTDRILITDRKPPGLVTLDDILVVNLEGDVVEGEGQTYSEIYMHTGVYKARKDVNAVVHTHSEYARALGMVGISFQPTSNEGAAYINTGKNLSQNRAHQYAGVGGGCGKTFGNGQCGVIKGARSGDRWPNS